MLNGRKKICAIHAAIAMAAASLTATPGSAQTGGGTGGRPDQCYPVNSPYDCCEYVEAWGGWYRFYVWGFEPCFAYGSPVEPEEPSQESPESPGI